MSIDDAREVVYAAAAVATIAGFVLAMWEHKRRDDVGEGGTPIDSFKSFMGATSLVTLSPSRVFPPASRSWPQLVRQVARRSLPALSSC